MEFYCNTLRYVNKRGNEILSLKFIYEIFSSNHIDFKSDENGTLRLYDTID